MPLMLRKPDERRGLTQRWRFTEGGRLMCSHHGLFVQAKDGFMGLRGGEISYGYVMLLLLGYGEGLWLVVLVSNYSLKFVVFITFRPGGAGWRRMANV